MTKLYRAHDYHPCPECSLPVIPKTAAGRIPTVCGYCIPRFQGQNYHYPLSARRKVEAFIAAAFGEDAPVPTRGELRGDRTDI